VLDKYSVDLGSLDSTLVYHLQECCVAFFVYLSSITYLIVYKPILVIPLLLLVVSVYWIHGYCAPAVIAQR